MIIKKIFSLAASTISLIIFIIYFITNCNAEDNNIKLYSKDNGILSIMYHRFNESKYPSTNIQMDIFTKHIELITQSEFSFYHPEIFLKDFNIPKTQKKILLSIDDAYESFYTEAWPYLKANKIPFILFVSTQPVGKNGYMTWQQIKEIEKADFVMIGHHSHSHDYLIDETNQDFIKDIKIANNLFIDNIGYIPSIFSYPFGEYSKLMKNFISNNFELSFGQHSGVIDINKDKYELPRFPINEKYGELKRFKSIINYFPLEYKKLTPEEKKINEYNNPPNFEVEFFKDQKNIKNITCYSNEGGNWEKSKIEIIDNKLSIIFREPFIPRRGRINCSLNEDGKWRWFGTQFTIRPN